MKLRNTKKSRTLNFTYGSVVIVEKSRGDMINLEASPKVRHRYIYIIKASAKDIGGISKESIQR